MKKYQNKLERTSNDERAIALFWAVNGLRHLSEDEIGMKTLVRLTTQNILYGPEEVIMIGLRPMGMKGINEEDEED